MRTESVVVSTDRRVSRTGRAAVFALSLAVLGYGIVTVVDSDLVKANAATPSIDANKTVASVASVDESALPATKQERVATAADATADPRECDVASGISSACIFE